MIKDLYVSNLAIIEDIHVTFNEGMTVLTGQTGAGKSLIIDSISLLLGARADTDLIRYNENKASILGVFSNDKKISDLLVKNGIDLKDNLYIKREINSNGKSMAKVNDVNVNLVLLKELSYLLADIHTQHDSLRLINPETYLDILDEYAINEVTPALNDYRIKFFDYKSKYQEYQNAINKNKEINDQIDVLKFQYEEISKLDLKENEDDLLSEEINLLSNFDKIYSSLNESYECLNDGFLDNLYNSFSLISKITDYNENYAKMYKVLEESYYNIEDISKEMKKEINKMDFDPVYLDSLITREQEIKKITNKYHKGVNDLINYQNEISKKIKMNENYDDYLNDCLNELKQAFEKLLKSNLELMRIREKAAKNLQNELMKECLNLDLKNINFEIVFNQNEIKDHLSINAFTENGNVKCDFLVSLNFGEPTNPLHKVASGGEISRIMLGLKSIIANKQNLSFMVFDEIDSGVSGITASKIAKKIHDISKHTQILCITHLPQVAALAENYLQIKKIEENNRTKTSVKYLENDEKIRDLAVMISGQRITESALSMASDMINNPYID